MASELLGIHGYNKVDGTEKLIGVWAVSPVIYNSTLGTWEKAPITLTSGKKAEMRTFLDEVFFVNGFDSSYSFDGSTWSTTRNLTDSPIAMFIERYNVRLYLLDIKISGVRYPSRVWFSDLPKNGAITWGLETGSDLSQTAGSAVITSAGSLFKTRNIKTGDPFTITSGTNAGEYIVQSIDSETQITLTVNLTNSASNSTFWVGGNYFDVDTDDGDTGKGFGKNSNELLVFKRNTLWRFNHKGQELRQVKGAVGTTSRRSIVSVGDYTYYYHPSGIQRCNGTSSISISSAIEDIIDGVTTDNQSEVIGWVENENNICMYLGDVTLVNGDTITNCVVDFDSETETWSPRSYPFAIRAATTWLQDDIPSVYVGDDTSHIYKLDTGNDFNGDDIPFSVEKTIYPAGTNAIVNFDRLRLSVENGPDLSVLYKLVHIPTGKEGHWISDLDWHSMSGTSEGTRTDFYFDDKHNRACGVVIKIIESSKSIGLLIEKMTLYYSNEADN